MSEKWEYVWLVYVDVGNGWALRVIASSEPKARGYSRFFRKWSQEKWSQELPAKVSIQKCSLDHMFGESMIDLPRGYIE